jgi:hypothetical protein
MGGKNYNIDDFLAMENKVAAYWALFKAIQNSPSTPSDAEMRVLSLPDFLGLCCANGFDDLYWQAGWAAIPSAELMEAIGEPQLSQMLWKCIDIAREYGKKVGKDPFAPEGDYVDLDEETEAKFNSPDLNFCSLYPDWDDCCTRTIDYVRKNRHLFT